jgi:tetratricopeptide (TPR) repeat protein
MQNRILTSALVTIVAAIATLAPAHPAHAMTAEQYFTDGNRLFRDDLYWAALLRYEQANQEGLDTPLLHYNTGIAHYRANQHIRARESLLQALGDPTLTVAAQYNLGLNAYALGETDEALRWFRLARDQNQNQTLQYFAVIAISRIRQEQEVPTQYEERVAKREPERTFTDLELRASLGYGNDTNVFRSPDQPYIDYSNPNEPTVTPVVQSGAFIPVTLAVKYRINSLPYEGFYAAYRLVGRYYMDKELENGNESLHQLSVGNEYARREGNRERRVESAFRIAQHNEVYYDPDDGGSRIINGEDADDRMNYLRYGPTLLARQSGEKFSMGFGIRGELWDYEQTNVLSEYDHEYFRTRVFGQYKFTSSTLLRLTAEYYTRRFSDRPSHDLDGQQRIGNPNIRYDYAALALRVRQRITDDMWIGFDARRTQRTDEYLGYNDYTRDSLGLEYHWSPGYHFDVEVGGVYQLYDFPNAFAFHNPAQGQKTQEALLARVLVSYRVKPRLSVFLGGRHKETVSNDIRIQYDRSQYSIGVRWDH